jgi:histone H3/H4
MNWQANNLEEENVISNTDDVLDCHKAVQFAVIKICKQQDNLISTHRTSPRAMAALAELTYQYAKKVLASDLDCFAQHAGRRTINEHDVNLVVRRNPFILTELQNKQRRNLSKDTTCLSTTTAQRKQISKIDLQRKNKRIIGNCENKIFDESDSSNSTDEDLVFERCLNRTPFGNAHSKYLERETVLFSSRQIAETKHSVASSAKFRCQDVASIDAFIDSGSESSPRNVFLDSDSESLTSEKHRLKDEDKQRSFRLQTGIDRFKCNEESYQCKSTKSTRIEHIMDSTLSQHSITSTDSNHMTKK